MCDKDARLLLREFCLRFNALAGKGRRKGLMSGVKSILLYAIAVFSFFTRSSHCKIGNTNQPNNETDATTDVDGECLERPTLLAMACLECRVK